MVFLRLIDRRAFLAGAGALLVGACTSGDSDENSAPAPATEGSSTTASSTRTTPEPSADDSTAGAVTMEPLTPAAFLALPTCILTEEAAEGPFPSQAPLIRQAIHEDLPGHPLRIGLRVVDQDCEPVPGSTVDIWHADASGDYSEYSDGGSGKDEGEGSTFCRGAQTSDAEGILEFMTIYPGWYGGRTVHIHATVRIDDQPVLTTQLYLDETLSETVHLAGEYAQFGPQDTSWAADGLAGSPADNGSLLVTQATETPLGSGTLALLNLGIEVG